MFVYENKNWKPCVDQGAVKLSLGRNGARELGDEIRVDGGGMGRYSMAALWWDGKQVRGEYSRGDEYEEVARHGLYE
jgi:hypothetical protein